MTFDFGGLLAALSDLGAERVVDPANGDRVDVNTGFREAITIAPDPDTGVYRVDVTTWDATGGVDGEREVGVFDTVEEVAARVREVAAEIEEGHRGEDAALSAADPEVRIPEGASRVGMVTMRGGSFDVNWTR